MYKIYKACENFAKFHETSIRFGKKNISEKIPGLLTEKDFDMEFGKKKYVICELEDGFFIVICTDTILTTGTEINTCMKIIGSGPALFVSDHVDNQKFNTFMANNKPQINFMLKQSFLVQISHVTSPLAITKVDCTEELSIIFKSKTDLSQLKFMSPEAAWYRLQPGDVIKIENTNVSSGVAIDYRVVV